MSKKPVINADKKTVNFADEYPVFKSEMKKDYTILIPNMLPWHFDILSHILRLEGYNAVILDNDKRQVVDEGLKHTHNDACYPAICVIGQYLDALKSGKYDIDKTAVLITQTGGGCRASNYIPLIRKALKEEFPKVPVLSLNFSGLEKGNGLELTIKLLIKLAYGVFYGDTIMTVFNQVKPYEVHNGDAQSAREKAVALINKAFENGTYKKLNKYHKEIFDIFGKIETLKEKKVQVGIVGEIYVKYSPLGNNRLEEFLLKEGCEPVVPALLDFVLYCCINNINDAKFYGIKSKATILFKIAYAYLKGKQSKIIKLFEKDGRYRPMHKIEHLRKCADKYINQAVKMGEGWLIPAEMAAFADTGTDNIVCAQPFGCLPNHIVGKGVVRALRKAYPKENIVPVDYDASATKVNQENRIKLMIATARENMK